MDPELKARVESQRYKEQKILEILDDLLREEDILACMVARRGLEGIMPPRDRFKIKDMGIWSTLEKTMDEFFEIISRYSEYNLDKVYFELEGYDVIFFILFEDFALVLVVPALANRGLLEVEMENARRNIFKIIGRYK